MNVLAADTRMIGIPDTINNHHFSGRILWLARTKRVSLCLALSICTMGTINLTSTAVPPSMRVCRSLIQRLLLVGTSAAALTAAGIYSDPFALQRYRSRVSIIIQLTSPIRCRHLLLFLDGLQVNPHPAST